MGTLTTGEISRKLKKLTEIENAAQVGGGGEKVLVCGRYVLLTLPEISSSSIADAIRIVEAKEEACAGEKRISVCPSD